MGLFVTTLLLTTLDVIRLCSAVIVGGVVLPHGDFALDPALIDGKNGSQTLHDSAKRAADWVRQSLRPDIVFLISPHGLELSEHYVLYLNGQGAGTATVGRDLLRPLPRYEVSLQVSMNRSLANSLFSHLHRAREKSGRTSPYDEVESLLSFLDMDPAPLGYGEIFPLLFLNRAGVLEKASTLILSIPTARYNHTNAMIPSTLSLGQKLSQFFELLDARVVIAVSTDLAHKFEPWGPFGYNAKSAAFDAAMGEWASTLNADALLKVGAALEEEVYSCGYLGLVALQGVINASSCNGSTWNSRLLANEHPTYYGMMVATFERMM